MLLRLLLISLLTSLSFMSRPAHASRASACKAPPFAVPRETQRAVDAAIDARVTGAGKGGASATVETRTDYETTTLTQDAAARSWVEYTLCLKRAKKMISQDLHDELLRALIAPAVASSLPAETPVAVPVEVSAEAPAPEATATAIAADQVTGSWQVASHFQWSTCPAPNDRYGTYAYTWLVGTDAADGLRVDVSGTTAFPGMTGRIQGDHLILEGIRGGHATPAAAWTFSHPAGATSTLYGAATVDVTLRSGSLIGTRDVVMYRDLGGAQDADTSDGVQLLPCLVRFDIIGTR